VALLTYTAAQEARFPAVAHEVLRGFSAALSSSNDLWDAILISHGGMRRPFPHRRFTGAASGSADGGAFEPVKTASSYFFEPIRGATLRYWPISGFSSIRPLVRDPEKEKIRLPLPGVLRLSLPVVVTAILMVSGSRYRTSAHPGRQPLAGDSSRSSCLRPCLRSSTRSV